MKKYVCFGAYEPKSIRTRIYVAIKHSFASFDWENQSRPSLSIFHLT